MPKMNKSQLIDAVSESSGVSKNDVKTVIENMATVGYKELNESGEFVIPGFVKMTVVNKPATETRSGINPHERADGICGKTGEQNGQGISPESGKRRGLNRRAGQPLGYQFPNPAVIALPRHGQIDTHD
jgi:DNA-binding protein HU-beta